MKAIILAAGQGTRLRPHTNNIPKCMVKFRGKEIIRYIIDTFKECAINDITVVAGYKSAALISYLKDDGVNIVLNNKFESSNMVSSLFCAKEFMCEDTIVSYSDIIYRKDILQKVINSPHEFSVAIDRDWYDLWKIRMSDPLADAETLKLKNGKIIELGRRPVTLDDIEGQYMGLFKISSTYINAFKRYYDSLDKDKLYDGKDFNNMYMTSLIQSIIDHDSNVFPVTVNGGWLEVDSVDDLKVYEGANISI